MVFSMILVDQANNRDNHVTIRHLFYIIAININSIPYANKTHDNNHDNTQNNDYGLSIQSLNRIIGIIKNYSHWKQSIHHTSFQTILTNDNTNFIESVSDAKRMTVAYCLSNVNLLKKNEHCFLYIDIKIVMNTCAFQWALQFHLQIIL